MYAAVSAACRDLSQLYIPKYGHILNATHQVVELYGGDALVDARNDLHRDGGRVDMLRVKPVTQTRHPSGDFVELDAFLASIWREMSVLGE